MEKSSFSARVYALVRQIPFGCVLTYGKIAALLGEPHHSRLVGRALSHIPSEESVPAHRVVGASGKTAPSFPAQRSLLESEGVTFRESGNVHLKHHLWR